MFLYYTEKKLSYVCLNVAAEKMLAKCTLLVKLQMTIYVIIPNRCGKTESDSAKRAFFSIENNIKRNSLRLYSF